MDKDELDDALDANARAPITVLLRNPHTGAVYEDKTEELTFSDAEFMRDCWENNPIEEGLLALMAEKFETSIMTVKQILTYRIMALPPKTAEVMRSFRGGKTVGVDSVHYGGYDEHYFPFES